MSDDGNIIDPPIVAQEYIYGVNVVDFGEARVTRGLSKRPRSSCKHLHTLYDTHERRVWCSDCETTLDPFDMFEIILARYNDKIKELEERERKVTEAEKHSLYLIANKNIEKAWRGKTMAIPCPHCDGWLLPEDFKKIGSWKSGAIERQSRKHESKEIL
jgi:hypothetical protein